MISVVRKYLTKETIKPMREWMQAIPGTVEQYAGILARHFPELENVTTEEIDRILVDEMRNREEDNGR